MKPLPSGLSVVVPAYRSGGTLGTLVGRLAPVLPALAAEFEVILVNDGSDDDTWAVIRRLAAEHGFVRGIDLLRNYGQQNALLCGIRAARYDRIVTMDDDLQHPPETLPELVAALTAGRDVVYAAPEKEQHGLLRDLASRVTKFVWQYTIRGGITRKASAWRLFRTGLREDFAAYGGPHVSIDVLLTWGTSRFHAITVAHAPRARGKSNYTAAKLLRHALDVTMGGVAASLRWVCLAGLGFMVAGGLALLNPAGHSSLSGGPAAGFPFPLVAIVGGVLLLALGLLAGYNARRSGRPEENPVYVVREEISAGSGPAR